MRPEKKYLVEEVSTHLGKSEYVFLTNFDRVSVKDTEELRGELAKHEAEFHVVKNTIFNVAAKARQLPEFDGETFAGPTAIVVGGPNPSEVAKVLVKFVKDKDKNTIKSGVLGDKLLSADEVEALSKLPSLDVLRAQLLGLLSQPATGMVRVLVAGPQSLLNVLQAKVDKDNG